MTLGGRLTQVYSIKTKIYTTYGTVFRHRENSYEFDTKYNMFKKHSCRLVGVKGR
jgi:hypothetical protein